MQIDRVTASVIAQIKRYHPEDQPLPAFRIGDDDKSTDQPYVAFLPSEFDTASLTAGQYEEIHTQMIVIMAHNKLQASQIAHGIAKYITQDRQTLTLVDDTGKKIGAKRIENLMVRDMISYSPQLAGYSVLFEWRGRHDYLRESAPILQELGLATNQN